MVNIRLFSRFLEKSRDYSANTLDFSASLLKSGSSLIRGEKKIHIALVSKKGKALVTKESKQSK